MHSGDLKPSCLEWGELSHTLAVARGLLSLATRPLGTHPRRALVFFGPHCWARSTPEGLLAAPWSLKAQGKLLLLALLALSAFSNPTLRTRSIGAGGTRITRQPRGPETPGGSRRTRYRYGRPSWRRRTPCCGRKWWPCARSCPTTAPCCPATRPSTEPCEAVPRPCPAASLRLAP